MMTTEKTISERTSRNTPFRIALIELGIPQNDFAEMTGYRAETVSRWATGDQPVPQVVELAVELLRYKASMNPAGEGAQ